MRQKTTENTDVMDTMMIGAPPSSSIDDMPLTSYDEYKAYNAVARKENKRLGLCKYPCKPCPVELHPKERILFGRKDQPLNALPVYLSNHLIDYKETLFPGKTYDLPRVIINHLAERGVPVWEWFTNPDGSKETRISHKDPRFTLRTIYQE